MMQSGSIIVSLTDDGSGGWLATTSFQASAGGESYVLDGPTPVSLGDSITINPSCVECELQTSVTVGQSPEGARHAVAKGPAPAPATRAGVGKPPAKPSPGPMGPHGR